MTLKIRSRLPKSIQLFIMSKCYIHANLVKIRQLVHEILGTQHLLAQIWQFKSRSDLENRSMSPKANQLFTISQCYIHANLVEICQPVHAIWCTQALIGRSINRCSVTHWLDIVKHELSIAHIWAELSCFTKSYQSNTAIFTQAVKRRSINFGRI